MKILKITCLQPLSLVLFFFHFFHIKNLENFNQKYLAKLIKFTQGKISKNFPLTLFKNSEVLPPKKNYIGFEKNSQIYEILLKHYNVPSTKIVPQNNPRHQF
jgi:hypothetical protein